MPSPQSIEAIFAEALEIVDPEAQRAFLNRACAGDANLRREIDELLEAGSNAESNRFMAVPPSTANFNIVHEVATAVYDEAAAELLGSRVGAYTLTKFLGEGSACHVYGAETN